MTRPTLTERVRTLTQANVKLALECSRLRSEVRFLEDIPRSRGWLLDPMIKETNDDLVRKPKTEYLLVTPLASRQDDVDSIRVGHRGENIKQLLHLRRRSREQEYYGPAVVIKIRRKRNGKIKIS